MNTTGHTLPARGAVLVVDPKDELAARIGDRAGSAGFSVDVVRSVDDALVTVNRASYAALLLSDAFPWSALRHVVRLARIRLARVRVVVCDTTEGHNSADLAVRLGADALWERTQAPADLVRFFAELEPEEPRTIANGKAHVLVVDDDEMVRDSVRDVLSEHYEVLALRSPFAALRALREQRFDVLMSDLLMDEMDGMDLIRAAKTIGPLLVAVVMTGFGSKESAIDAVKEGAYEFLEKPLTPSLLIQTVERAWGSQRVERQNRWLLNELRQTNDRLTQEMAERKRIESELLQAQKLEAVGQLAAGIAHEINTPLQYIGDNTKFVAENLPGVMAVVSFVGRCLERGDGGCHLLGERFPLPKEEIDYLTRELPLALTDTLEGVGRLDGIVQAMREFAHPGTGEKINLNINQSLERMATVSRNEWKLFADLVTDFDPDLPEVPCLPSEINQAFLNVIINAAHAIREVKDGADGHKGKITVVTRRLDDWIRITIADDGCGIPPEIRDRIFDPFFTTKPVGQGTGQGLAITRSVIVNKHNGKLSCQSEPGRGTEFEILLPLRAPQ